MARRTFDVVDVTEIFIHWYAGRSLSEVSMSLGVDRKTIRKYLAPAVAAGLAPGGPAMSRQDSARAGEPVYGYRDVCDNVATGATPTP